MTSRRKLNVGSPTVWRSPFLFSPCLDGLRRPAILLPEDVGNNLRETFIHELAHLARRDGLWNLLRRWAIAGCWFQPLLWVLSRRLEAGRRRGVRRLRRALGGRACRLRRASPRSSPARGSARGPRQRGDGLPALDARRAGSSASSTPHGHSRRGPAEGPFWRCSPSAWRGLSSQGCSESTAEPGLMTRSPSRRTRIRSSMVRSSHQTANRSRVRP